MYSRKTIKKVSIQKKRVKSSLKSDVIGVLYLSPLEEFSIDELIERLHRKGLKYARGSLKNALCMLKKRNLVTSRRSFRTSYYKINKREYDKSDVTVWSCDKSYDTVVSEGGFVNSILELARANGFESVCNIHDVFLVSHFWFVDAFHKRVHNMPSVWVGESEFQWKRNGSLEYYWIRLFLGKYDVTLRVFDVGKIDCKVKGSFPDRLNGLRTLDRVINDALLVVFGKNRHYWTFPSVDNWIVRFWHMGIDSKKKFMCKFEVLFKDYFNGLAHIYVRKQDGRLRVENFQNPNKTLGLLMTNAEKIQKEWMLLEAEKQAFETEMPSMVASCFTSCVNEFKGNPLKFVEPDLLEEKKGN